MLRAKAFFAQPIRIAFLGNLSSLLQYRYLPAKLIMSFYFAIIGTKDNPLFEHEFGSSKQGGDGIAKFPEQARHMNQFIVHSSLDIVEEVQWGSGQMYEVLKSVNETALYSF
jgi:Sedlin, N-terminal conserved region